MKALVGAFNQEKALVGTFSVITNLRMQLFEALAEVLRSDGSTWCKLPDMINRVAEHTQAGLEVA